MPAAMDLMPAYNKRRRYSSSQDEYNRAPSPGNMHNMPYQYLPRVPRYTDHDLERPPKIAKHDESGFDFRRLAANLYGDRMPPATFLRLEHAFAEIQDENLRLRAGIERLRRDDRPLLSESRQAAARGQKIKEHETRIHRMKREMDDQDRKIAKLKGADTALNKLRSEVAEKDETLLLQDELMKASAKGIEQKRLQNERLEKENAALQNILAAREATIAGQNDFIAQMQNASSDAMTGLALEGQAQRTLGMIQGLQTDIMERDSTITQLTADVHQWKGRAADQARTNVEQQRELKDIEAVFNAARQRTAEAKQITEDQGKLIERLMEVNASLQPDPG